jgi:hypothetical protein
VQSHTPETLHKTRYKSRILHQTPPEAYQMIEFSILASKTKSSHS